MTCTESRSTFLADFRSAKVMRAQLLCFPSSMSFRRVLMDTTVPKLLKACLSLRSPCAKRLSYWGAVAGTWRARRIIKAAVRPTVPELAYSTGSPPTHSVQPWAKVKPAEMPLPPPRPWTAAASSSLPASCSKLLHTRAGRFMGRVSGPARGERPGSAERAGLRPLGWLLVRVRAQRSKKRWARRSPIMRSRWAAPVGVQPALPQLGAQLVQPPGPPVDTPRHHPIPTHQPEPIPLQLPAAGCRLGAKVDETSTF
jgi:hypothetical protein|eukprot:COSAG01_NODE_4734_length_4785_cov_8.029236_3_plen_255_part_00